ncbi:hypothetical protein E2493_20790 [Sphingomonas parva]|uniref:Uncharacterized protein n=1 Tax=Sphingomonas parva TaxID=2555898 RepID=A0A4Y8ZJZ8_9SPHN|nr:hypothetical protein [Sphingomonas parva]TFI56321.1 hypothetical protein E2493_20790 [Sphingomonas parva]
MTALEYIWTAILVAAWLGVSTLMIRTAWSGKFWFGRKNAGGRRWPPLRAESPVRFWGLWAALSWPFLMLPLLIGIGLVAPR